MSDQDWDEGESVPSRMYTSSNRPESRGRRGGGRGRGEGQGNWRSEARWNAGRTDVLTFSINSSDAGRIIGRGGTKVQELEKESGARIKLGKQDSGGVGRTTVSLSGSDESRARAKQLIDTLLGSGGYQGEDKPTTRTPYDRNQTGLFGKESFLPREEDRPVINWDEVNAVYEENQRQKWLACPPIKKDFYDEDPDVAALSPEEVKQIRASKNNIVISRISLDSEQVCDKEWKTPNPVRTFKEAFAGYPELLVELDKQGFTEPTPIQCQAWPVILLGHDLIGIAQTGTGKTLAFLLPALIHIDNQPIPRSARGGPTVLVLAPTRELALQIESEVKKYTYRGIKCACLYGGGSRQDQVDLVSRGVEIIIATPGRLNDLVSAGQLSLKSVTFIVLDEADRMLDMGFEPQIRKSLLEIRPDRQTVMTSATWPEGVRRLAKSYMCNPFQVFIGTLDLAAVHTVKQTVEMIDEGDKRSRLMEIFESMKEDDKVLVFVGKKMIADDISSDLTLAGLEVQCMHGDREQSEREQALLDIKTGLVRILIATDLAARGIDIEDISLVVNFDFPRTIEEYVHRVGRTGRAGRSGLAITFFSRNDWAQANELIKILQEANQEVPDELVQMADRFMNSKYRERAESGRGRGFGGRGGGHGGSRSNSYWK